MKAEQVIEKLKIDNQKMNQQDIEYILQLPFIINDINGNDLVTVSDGLNAVLSDDIQIYPDVTQTKFKLNHNVYGLKPHKKQIILLQFLTFRKRKLFAT